MKIFDSISCKRISFPSKPQVDAHGKLIVDKSQGDLNGLLRWSTQDVIDARRGVRTLIIQYIHRIDDAWPVFPSLEHLTITVERSTLRRFPRVLRASALPALQCLTLRCESARGGNGDKVDDDNDNDDDDDDDGTDLWACPVLEGRFKKLRDITIVGLAMNTEAIDALLLQQSSLATLHLISINIGKDESAYTLRALEQHASRALTHVHLWHRTIAQDRSARLARALPMACCPDLTRLIHLDLGNRNLGARGCARLAQALLQHTGSSLTHIHLGGNNIGNQGCAHLAYALQQYACPDLTYLDLERNAIGAEGCAHLALALQQYACPRLAELRLGINSIGNEGCMHLAQGLQHHADGNVVRIRLGLQSLGADECAGVARAVQKHPGAKLTHLKLATNRISDEGCGHLARALQQRACPILTHLDLCGNIRIGKEVRLALARGLREGCLGIQDVRLSGVRIGSPSWSLDDLRLFASSSMAW